MGRITAASLTAKHPTLAAILAGEYDGELLEDLEHAISIRKKTMFQKGTLVRISGTRNPELDGRTGTVLKVNATRISVGLGEKTEWGFAEEYLFPARMLTPEEVTV